VKATLLAAALLAAALPGSAADYGLDPTHSFATLEAPRFGLATWRGRLRLTEGTLQLDRDAQTAGAEITIALTSLSSGAASVDQALTGPGGLDTAAFPLAVFKAERVAFAGKNPSEVAGSLTLRGRTAPLTLTAIRFNCYFNPLFLREVCGGDFEARLKPADWALGGAAALGLPDEWRLVVQIEAIKQ